MTGQTNGLRGLSGPATVQDVAHAAGETANSATTSVGQGLRAAAESLRQHSPEEGVLGAAAGAVANVLEHGGHYLEERNLGGLAEDAVGFVRRHPLPAVLLGVGLGLILIRSARR